MITSLIALAALTAVGQYSITPIVLEGSFPSNGRYQINAAGQISGMNGATNPSTAFIWTPNGSGGTMKHLLYKTFWSDVHGLNRFGDAVGTAYGVPGAGGTMPTGILWPSTGNPFIVDSSGWQQNGKGVNDSGDVALYYKNQKYSGIVVSRLVKGKRTSYRLGGSWPSRINNACQVLAMFRDSDGSGAKLFTPNASKTAWTSRDTGLVMAWDLNDAGAAVGDTWFWIGESSVYDRPTVFVASAMYDLPAGTTNLWNEVTTAVIPALATSWSEGSAYAINNFGVVVGRLTGYNVPLEITESKAWIRTPFVGVTELTADGYIDLDPHDINDSGQIVATATSLSDGLRYCILMTPF